MIAVSERRISEGKNIEEASIVPGLIVGTLLLLLVAGGGIIVMVVRHHKTHAVYQQHVGAGTAAPLSPGAPAQYMVPYPQPQQYPQQPLPQQQQNQYAPPTTSTPLQQPPTGYEANQQAPNERQ